MKSSGVFTSKMIVLAALTSAMVGGGPNLARAEKMDAAIHTVVIEKLEQTLKETRESENLSLRPTRARLADLYAERARLRAMNEAETNCNECTGALEDRKKALALYDVVLREADRANRGPLMLQMAQMRELNGEFKKAESLYNQVVTEGRSQHAAAVLSEAYLGRAEALFAHGDVNKAQKDFETAHRLVGPGRKGQVMSRIAWCQLNKGEQGQAVRTMIHILETPDLLTRESSEGTAYDASFHEDIARDLATFLARGDVTRREIRLMESLAPERAKKETLRHLAGECERLGQKKAAIEVWAIEAKYETTPAERLEAMVRIAQIRFELGEKKEALAGMRAALAEWARNGCADGEICSGLKLRLRNLVIAWNKSEKKAPSALLLDAYLAYLGQFGDDMEMNQWAGEAARGLKKYAVAAGLFHKSAGLASTSKEKNAKQLLETALHGEVEMAEISKDPGAREKSYEHYLALNPNGAINAKVRYQRAHVSYERGQMAEASNRFHEFAASFACQKSGQETQQLCVQAADLDLDALAGMRAHATVQARGLEYAKLFPARRQEYGRISRTAVLKQAEGMEPQAAIAKLAEADFTAATTAERVKYLKTYLALTEKARDLEATRRGADALLATPGLSASDREFALGKKAWAAEMALDFAQAYSIVRKMKLASMRADEKAMKLTLLAELSGNDPKPHELEFLRASRDGFQKAFVQAKMVRASRHPQVELAKYEKSLRAYPALLASVTLEVFAKTGNISIAERILRDRRVVAEPAGRALARELFVRDFLSLERAVSRHRLHAGSDALMQASLAQRLKMLAQAEKAGNQAIASRDWAAQIVALSLIARENRRTYGDIVALPVPKKLKGEQRRKYQIAVEANARVYLRKHDQVAQKLAELWADSASQEELARDYRTAQPMVRGLIATELRKLSEIAPDSRRSEIASVLRNGVQMPSEKALADARREAKEKPFSAVSLGKLRDLEVVRGRETMVAYLDARLLKLRGEKQ